MSPANFSWIATSCGLSCYFEYLFRKLFISAAYICIKCLSTVYSKICGIEMATLLHKRKDDDTSACTQNLSHLKNKTSENKITESLHLLDE